MGPTTPLTTQRMAAVTKAFRVPASLAPHSRVITMNFCLEDSEGTCSRPTEKQVSEQRASRAVHIEALVRISFLLVAE